MLLQMPRQIKGRATGIEGPIQLEPQRDINDFESVCRVVTRVTAWVPSRAAPTRVQAYRHTCTRSHTHTHTHILTRTHTHTHMYVSTLAHTNTYTYIHAFKCIHKHMDLRTHTCSRTRTRTQRTCTRQYTHTLTRTRTRIRIRTRTRTHAHTHARTHARTHTHTCAHTQFILSKTDTMQLLFCRSPVASYILSIVNQEIVITLKVFD